MMANVLLRAQHSQSDILPMIFLHNVSWSVNPHTSVLRERENVKYNVQEFIIVILTPTNVSSVQMVANIVSETIAQVVCLVTYMFSNWQVVLKYVIALINIM